MTLGYSTQQVTGICLSEDHAPSWLHRISETRWSPVFRSVFVVHTDSRPKNSTETRVLSQRLKDVIPVVAPQRYPLNTLRPEDLDSSPVIGEEKRSMRRGVQNPH
jgi:hypothetical protein